MLSVSVPAQQRQVGRILLMPWVYGVMSFLSYRYFRDYIYFELIQVCQSSSISPSQPHHSPTTDCLWINSLLSPHSAYEGIVISAFLLLLVEFVSASASKGDVRNALARKEKVALPMTVSRSLLLSGRLPPSDRADTHVWGSDSLGCFGSVPRSRPSSTCSSGRCCE